MVFLATAYHKTTSTTHQAVVGASGIAYVDYYISGATPGYRVAVVVQVRRRHRSGTCTTSFAPHAD